MEKGRARMKARMDSSLSGEAPRKRDFNISYALSASSMRSRVCAASDNTSQ